MGEDKFSQRDVGMPTVDLTLVKIHTNSVISTPEAQYMMLDMKNFYLNMPMVQYKYVKIRIDDVPDKIIVKYSLKEKVTSDGCVCICVDPKGHVWFATSRNISTEVVGTICEHMRLVQFCLHLL